MSTPEEIAASITLKDSLPRAWFTEAGDPDGIVTALVSVLDAGVQADYAEITALRSAWQPLLCDARFLPYLAQKLGWSLEDSVTSPTGELASRTEVVRFQRKLVSLLVALYRQKGTQPGIVNGLRLFLGMDVTIRGLFADGWRLGQSHLGGKRVAVTASGSSTTFIDLSSTGSTPLRYTVDAGSLSVWRNGVLLRRGQYLESAAGITLVTADTVYIADGSETAGTPIALGFSYVIGAGVLNVYLNGSRLIDNSWSEPTTTSITLTGALQRGDEVIVRRNTGPTALTAGDAVVVRSIEDDPTRLAPDFETTPERALRLIVEFPRVLLVPELFAAQRIVDVMRPAKANVVLVQPSTARNDRARWRLGTGAGVGLGRGTRLGRGP